MQKKKGAVRAKLIEEGGKRIRHWIAWSKGKKKRTGSQRKNQPAEVKKFVGRGFEGTASGQNGGN